MKSITHAPGQNASTRKLRRTSRSSSEQVSDQIRGFYYDTRRAALGHDYLWRRWLPREGPLFYAFIQVMRSFCYYNPQTGELREQCYPKVDTIAERCGVNPATIHRLIQRDPNTGEFLSKNAEALKRFIKVQPRWLYNPQVGHKTQRSNLYLVALDDPPVPEDEHLVEEKAGELAAILTMEQVRQQRQGLSAPEGEREPTDSHFASLYALAKCESVMSRKMQDKTLPLTITSNTYLERTLGERSSADWSIRKQEDEERALGGGERASSPGEQQRSRPAHSVQTHRTSLVDQEAKKRQQTQPLAKAHPQVGDAIHQALRDLGGSNPAGGVQTILEALVEMGTPPERMHDLFVLGLRRLEQQQALFTIPNPTGYLIGIMRHVAVEAMVKGWNVAAMREEDEGKYRAAQRRAAGTGQAGQVDEAAEARAEASASTETVPGKEGEDVEPPAASSPPPPDLPAGVELLEEPALATLCNFVPDPDTGEHRSLTMLWGFVRQALFEQQLSLARRQHLDNLIPKWDEGRPRTLLLLSSTTYTARFVAQVLRRDIQQQLDQRLYPYFDDVQVAFAPAQEGER